MCGDDWIRSTLVLWNYSRCNLALWWLIQKFGIPCGRTSVACARLFPIRQDRIPESVLVYSRVVIPDMGIKRLLHQGGEVF